VFEFVWNLLSFVIALGILVTAHEYGHYWVAKKNNVRVLRFSVGFGKAIWRRVDKEGTEFVVSIIPLGGYVRMLDERVDDVLPSEKHLAFNNKSVYQRIAIIAAGPGANFLFALVAFYFMFMIGVPSVKPVTGTIVEKSIAGQAGMTDKLEIISIAGDKTATWSAVNLALVSQIGEPSIAIEARSTDSVSTQVYQLDTRSWKFDPDKSNVIASLGLAPYRTEIYTELAVIADDSAGKRAGLQAGDLIVSANGIDVRNKWNEFSKIIQENPNNEVAISVERKGELLSLFATPGEMKSDEGTRGYLGVSPKTAPYPQEYLFDEQFGPIAAIGKSFERTWQLIVLSFEMIGKLITGDVSVKNLGGPISMAEGAGTSAGFGFVYFLGFLAFISINLGIINILPLPVLDGGHLVYYLIELLTGKPVPEKVQEAGFKFGALALLCIMSIAILNDLSRL